MSVQILPTQIITLTELSESVFNSDTDFLLSITPETYSSTGYSSMKAQLPVVNICTQSVYSVTSSHLLTSSYSIYTDIANTSSFTINTSSSMYSVSSSVATSASRAISSSLSNSSSYTNTSISSSISDLSLYVPTASYTLQSMNSLTASYNISSSHSKTSSFDVMAKTASHAEYIYEYVLALQEVSSQESSSWTSQSISSSYTITSSYIPTSSLVSTSSVCRLTSSNSIASSTSTTSSISDLSTISNLSINSVSSSYAIYSPTASFLITDTTIANSFVISNPLGAISDGIYIYILQYNPYTSLCRFLRKDTTTDEIVYIYAFSSSYSIYQCNLSKIKANDNTDYICINGTGRKYLYAISGDYSGSMYKYETPSVGNQWNVINIDNITGPNGQTAFYSVDSHFSVFNLAAKCLLEDYHNGTGYTYVYLAQNTLNFTKNGSNPMCVDSKFVNYTNLEPVNAYILYCWYNQHLSKKRIYLMTNGSGLMHIFNLLNYNGNFIQWAQDNYSNRVAGLTYEKSFTVGAGDAYWSDTPPGEKYAIDVNLDTGVEQYITSVRRGNGSLQGLVTRSPWPIGV